MKFGITIVFHIDQQKQGILGLHQYGLLGNGDMLGMQQDEPSQFFPSPLQSPMAFQQQIGLNPGLPFHLNELGGRMNFVGGPMLASPPWPATSMGQSALNPAQFRMGLQAQQASGPTNGGEQVGPVQGQQNGQNPNQLTKRLNFGHGRGSGGGGRRGRYRGSCGRLGGSRGRFQSPQNG